MIKRRLKGVSFVNLITGYLLSIVFFFIIFLNRPNATEIASSIEESKILFTEINSTKTEKEYIYFPSSPKVVYRDILVDSKNDAAAPVLVRDNKLLSANAGSDIVISQGGIDHEISKNNRVDHLRPLVSSANVRVHNFRNRSNMDSKPDEQIDRGLLDRRLAEYRDDRFYSDRYIERNTIDTDSFSLDNPDAELNLSKLTVHTDGDDTELGEIDINFDDSSKGYGIGKGGELYAYNFPSQGVGAGIGSAGLGAGAGGGAGLGAGIGEGILNGETVPTLGGIGDGAKSLYGEPVAPAGVGGLVGGAGAGGAAGLTQGYITEKLGLGVGIGNGMRNGGRRQYNYDHLPKNGALHIMIHVDGSGSILATRKQLDIMKDTLLKEALLPYYNNDENLYNKRVSIIDSSGERSLQFFKEASKKDNVLAIAFQDEAAPDYHLPNFNKKPQDAYSYDLNGLKNVLRGHKGLYRGIMFQVDRGRVFSKSFKEMVQFAWNGEGYLAKQNLKQYHRDNNLDNIKLKKGIVFSDEYHATSEGDPQYYLDLIFKASKKIGIDLNVYSAGLLDGVKY